MTTFTPPFLLVPLRDPPRPVIKERLQEEYNRERNKLARYFAHGDLVQIKPGAACKYGAYQNIAIITSGPDHSDDYIIKYFQTSSTGQLVSTSDEAPAYDLEPLVDHT
jgi:hypothetical protein